MVPDEDEDVKIILMELLGSDHGSCCMTCSLAWRGRNKRMVHPVKSSL